MPHWLFYRCIFYISGPGNISVVLLSMQGQIALRFHQKYLNLCSEDERRFYVFGTTWGWVINDIIFILGWTNHPLRSFYSCKLEIFLLLCSSTNYFKLKSFLKNLLLQPSNLILHSTYSNQQAMSIHDSIFLQQTALKWHEGESIMTESLFLWLNYPFKKMA